MRIRSLILEAVICVFLVSLPIFLSAQPGGPGGDPDPRVPIDGGLSLLIAAGVGYAAKKAHDKRKTAKTGKE